MGQNFHLHQLQWIQVSYWHAAKTLSPIKMRFARRRNSAPCYTVPIIKALFPHNHWGLSVRLRLHLSFLFFQKVVWLFRLHFPACSIFFSPSLLLHGYQSLRLLTERNLCTYPTIVMSPIGPEWKMPLGGFSLSPWWTCKFPGLWAADVGWMHARQIKYAPKKTECCLKTDDTTAAL